ncbi:PAS domain S-box protein [Natronosalvus vescus]|uniref:PAS domain S-box protein n=1 Tax=Natronosalvus vescus TaxID=2953881 RepID=UPI0020912ED0|nr:PAS domain S-box protein [Natronosalvus vescus]
MPDSGARRSTANGTLLYVDPTDRSPRTVEALESSCPGLEVTAVETAADAISTLGDQRVDCVVVASPLSRSDSLSFTRTVRRTYPETPVILYASDGSEAFAATAIDAGVSAYVPAVTDSDARKTAGTDTAALQTLCTRVIDVLADDAENRFGRVDAMHDVALEFESCHDPDGVYQLAVEAMVHVLESDASALYIESDGQLRPAAVAGEIVSELSKSFEVSEGVVGSTYRSGESSIVHHVDTGAEAKPVDERIRSGVSVPVGSFGVLQAAATDPASFTERDRTLAELLAAHVTAAISRIRSEKAVRRERDRFAALFENVPDAVAFLGTAGSDTIVDVNPAFERLFGYDRSEVIGDKLDEHVLPDGIEAVDVYDTVGVGEVISAEVTRQTANGPREFFARGFAVELDDTVYEYAIYTDITEQKRWETELEQYRTLVETVGDPMYILDTDGTIEVANDAMIDAVGTTREAVIGAHPLEFMPQEAVARGQQILYEIIDDDERTWGTFELTFTSTDGEEHVAEANIAPIADEEGTLIKSVGVIRDIGDRKEREQRIRALHDGTRRLMAAANADEVARVGCDIADEILDYQLNGIHRYDPEVDGLVPVAVSEGVRELFGEPPIIERNGGLAWDAYEAGQPIAHGDVRYQNGVQNPETPIRSEAHLPLGEYGLLLVASVDRNDFDEESLALANILAANVEAAIERAERESELDARRQELERQNERLEEFAGTVSHDLRNPLTLATGHLDLIADRATDDMGITDSLEEIEWALERMDELIDDVLALARSGRNLTDPESLALEDVVRQAGRTVDPDLGIEIEGTLPTVMADENRVLVFFENLFRNAIEHVGEDVTVTVGVTETGFYVADNGPGIPPEERSSVLESGYTTHPEGTGFGLAIVTEVAEAHGWDVMIAESEQGGARFDVEIRPAVAGDPSDQAGAVDDADHARRIDSE